MRKNSIKNTRINEAVRQELSMLISREVKDPRVDMMATVTRAIVATDLKTCKVYISVYGDEQKKEETMAGLKSSEGFLRRMLAKNLNLRNTPELFFILDESLDYAMYMSGRIDELSREENARSAEEETTEEPEDTEEETGEPDDEA